MADWSEDHVVAIGFLNLNFGTFGRPWLNWRPGGALSWKVDTTGWDVEEWYVAGHPSAFGPWHQAGCTA
jgi:hypothetical protein